MGRDRHAGRPEGAALNAGDEDGFVVGERGAGGRSCAGSKFEVVLENVETGADGLGEIPVQAQAVTGDLGGIGGRRQRSDAAEEGVVIDVNLRKTGHYFKRTPGAGSRIEGGLGRDTAVGGVFSGQHIADGEVDGGVGDFTRIGGVDEFRGVGEILGQDTQRTVVEISLRRNDRGTTVCDRGSTVGKEVLLAVGAVGIQLCAGVVAGGGGDTEAQPLKDRILVVHKRSREQTTGNSEVTFKIVAGRIGIAAVDDAVGRGDLVAEALLQHGAEDLHADITIGSEIGGDGALVEERDRIGLELLKADGGLEAADANVQGFGNQRGADVGVENGDGGAGKLGLDDVVETLGELALEDEAGATQEESVLGGVGIVEVETTVALHKTAQAERIGTV